MMLKFYFHLYSDVVSLDDEGSEEENDRAALETARDFARDAASENVRQGHFNPSHYVVCSDENGREVGIVRFADAVHVSH